MISASSWKAEFPNEEPWVGVVEYQIGHGLALAVGAETLEQVEKETNGDLGQLSCNFNSSQSLSLQK